MHLANLFVANLRDALLLNPFFPLRHLAVAAGLKELHLNIRGTGKVHFRTNDSDAVILRQIFRDEDYDLARYPHYESIQAAYKSILDRDQVPVIIDAGANIGASSRWFAKLFPGAQILSVEPQPQNAAFCRRNVAHLANVTVFEAAIGSTEGCVAIANTKAESWAFQTERCPDGMIPVVTIPQLAASVPNGRLFAAKIDVEGFESDLFSHDTAWIDDLKFFFIEPHDWMLPGAKTSRGFQTRLAQSDFDLIVAGENLLYVSNRYLPRQPEAEGDPITVAQLLEEVAI